MKVSTTQLVEPRATRLAGTVVIVILLGLGQYLGFDAHYRRLTQTLVRPFVIVSQRIVKGVEYPWWVVSNAVDSHRKIKELEEKYARALAELSVMEGIEQENQELKKIMAADDWQDRSVIIARPLFSQSRAAIDLGETTAVIPGMVVLVDRTVVGRIHEVEESFATIALLSEETESPLVVTTETGYLGLVTGDGRQILLTELPSDAQLQPGERVVTAGQPGVPKNLFVGTVGAENQKFESPVKTFIIDQPVTFTEARVVELYL